MLKTSKAALFAAMLSLSAVPAIGVLPAIGVETTTGTTGFTTTLSIPVIAAIESSMDEAALRDALSGGFLKHVDELAKLNAASITIPEITLTIKANVEGKPLDQVMTYKNIVLSDVKNGVAGSASVGSAETTSPEGSFNFGTMSAAAIDVGAILSLYSLVPGGDSNAPMKTLYKDFTFAGGSFSSPEATCKFGKVSAASFEARPLKYSFAQMMDAAKQLEDSSKGAPSPEALSLVGGFIADIFQAFKSTPLSMEGLSCSGEAGAEGAEPFAFSIGGVTMEGYQPGFYPALAITDFKLSGGKGDEAGTISLGSASFKTIDLHPTIATLEDPNTKLSEDWLDANWRKLIPSVGGFAFSNLDIDIPNPDTPGERIVAKVGEFDLSLADYLNGVPTKISAALHGVDVPLPQNSSDPQMVMLLAAGLTHIKSDVDVSAAWDKEKQTIVVDKLAFSGDGLGAIALGMTLGNATELLFDANPQVAMMSGFGVTVQNVTLDVTDAGLGDIGWPLAAAEQGQSDVAAFRTQTAGLMEGLAIQLLGPTDAARSFGAAVSSFIAGTAKSLSVNVASKEPKGIPFALFMAAQQDPTVLSGLVDVTGSAK
ncbi:MAG: hypothetical protein ABIQ30_15730 [Devosia sp.]